MRFMENINADAVTISADLIWARRVHQLAARSVSLAGFAHHRVSLLVLSTWRLRLGLAST